MRPPSLLHIPGAHPHPIPPHLPWQTAFLEAVAAEGDEAWAAAERAFAPVLQRRPELAAEATSLAKAKGESCPCAASSAHLDWRFINASCMVNHPYPLLQLPRQRRSFQPACRAVPLLAAASGPLARALLGVAAAEGAAQQELVAALLPVFCEKVLAAKERGGAGALACWGALAGAASEEQVAGECALQPPPPTQATPLLSSLLWACPLLARSRPAAWPPQVRRWLGTARWRPLSVSRSSPQGAPGWPQPSPSPKTGARLLCLPVAGTLLPTVVRMMKRNPEVAMSAAVPMLAGVRCALARTGAQGNAGERCQRCWLHCGPRVGEAGRQGGLQLWFPMQCRPGCRAARSAPQTAATISPARCPPLQRAAAATPLCLCTQQPSCISPALPQP